MSLGIAVLLPLALREGAGGRGHAPSDDRPAAPLTPALSRKGRGRLA